MANNLAQRIAVSAVAIPAAVGLIWLGGWPLAATLALLGVLGAGEIYDFARRQGIEPLERTGWLAAAAIPLLAYWAKGSETHWAESAIACHVCSFLSSDQGLVHAASSAVMGDPSDHFVPGTRWNVQSFPSGEVSHDLAQSPTIL